MTTRLLLELDLTRGVLEAPPSSPLAALRARHTPSMRSLVTALDRAKDDDRVAGLVAHIGGPALSLAHVQELRDAVAGFRGSGKPAYAWAESFGELGPGTVPYYLATGFDRIWLQPSGELGFTGVAVEAVFLRDALEKLGVTPQLGKRREYKTAADTFTEREMTGPAREMAARLAASAYEQIVGGVAEARGLSTERVRELVDRAPLSAAQAQEAGLVDRLGYRSDVYADFGDTTPKLVERYHRRSVTLPRRKPVVAVIRISGAINLGRSRGERPFGAAGSGSDTVGAALRAVAESKQVRAVVLRVDSPGGSYVASDAIRHEVLRLRGTGRPVVASMASVAASGGYFVSMPSDVIVAQPGTITGSIGVLAGKGVLKDALARLGIGRDAVAEGRNARMFSAAEGFTDEQWRRLEEILDRIYEDFVTKAATDRSMPVDELEKLARGRVWTGADARSNGLVDELGGLDRAIELACRRANLDREDVAVRALPHRNLVDRLRPPQSTDDISATWMPGLDAPGVLSMPFTWRIR
jgi:protease IV